ncbi:MAG: hypothetical protein M0R02_16145 [Bacteroidales bacterium]|nr:hypothetical protein [Bacteroidales bacterium]
MRAATLTPLHILSRVGAALLGGYCFVWGVTTLGIVLATALGMSFGEARTLFYLLAFLLFVAVFCWAFATASQLRAWLVLAGGGAAMTLLGWLLAS